MSEREREARLQRLEALRAAGIDPYPARVDDRIAVAEVVRRFGDKGEEELEAAAETVAICGRVMAKRSFGKLLFLGLREDGVDIQVSGRKKEMDPKVFDDLKLLDVGDFVWVEGPVWRTKKGELTVGC